MHSHLTVSRIVSFTICIISGSELQTTVTPTERVTTTVTQGKH